MNVSLSTDDPLMLHYTKDPLVEEYSVATQVWKLSATDQVSIATVSISLTSKYHNGEIDKDSTLEKIVESVSLLCFAWILLDLLLYYPKDNCIYTAFIYFNHFIL
jgi:AMP deaminase